MRNDQIEAFAGEVAEAVARSVIAASAKLDPATADLLSSVAGNAARNAARQGVGKITAVRIEADTAGVKDLRTR
jgi:hypothetical protein